MEKLPSVQITVGSISSTWRSRYSWQFSISTGCGSRLPGGRHLSTLQIHTSGALESDLLQQLVQQPARAPDERQALLVLAGARRLAHEHQLGVRVAGAEHDRLARGRELGAALAGARLLRTSFSASRRAAAGCGWADIARMLVACPCRARAVAVGDDLR